jgi:hypothetical protein
MCNFSLEKTPQKCQQFMQESVLLWVNKFRMVGQGRNNLQLENSGQFYAAIANIRVGHCNAK